MLNFGKRNSVLSGILARRDGSTGTSLYISAVTAQTLLSITEGAEEGARERLDIRKRDVNFLFFIGLGIFLYGLTYFLVHDVFIHQRFKWLRNTRNWYARAVRKAHYVHHKYKNKEDGECFGMLVVPMQYFKEAYKKR